MDARWHGSVRDWWAAAFAQTAARVRGLPERSVWWLSGCALWAWLVIAAGGGDRQVWVFLAGTVVLLSSGPLLMPAVLRSCRATAVALNVAWFTFAAGLVVAQLDGTSGTTPTGPRWTDVFWQLSLAAAVVGVAAVLWSRTPVEARRKAVIDVSVVATTAVVVLWAFLVGPAAAGALYAVRVPLTFYGLWLGLLFGLAGALLLATLRSGRAAGALRATMIQVTVMVAVLLGLFVGGGIGVEAVLVTAVPFHCLVGGFMVLLPPGPRLPGRPGERMHLPTMSRARTLLSGVAVVLVAASLVEIGANQSGGFRLVGSVAVAAAVGCVVAGVFSRYLARERDRATKRRVAAVSAELASARTDDEVQRLAAQAIANLVAGPVEAVAWPPDRSALSVIGRELVAGLRDEMRRREAVRPTLVAVGRGRGAAAMAITVVDGARVRRVYLVERGLRTPHVDLGLEVLALQVSAALESRHRSAQTHRRRTEMQAEALVRWAAVPALAVDPDGEILAVSAALTDLVGWARGQLVGLNLRLLLDRSDADRLHALLSSPVDRSAAVPVRVRRGTASVLAVSLRAEARLPDGRGVLLVAGLDEPLGGVDATFMNRLSASVDLAPMAVAVDAAPGGLPVYVNAAHLERLVGWAMSDDRANPVSDVVIDLKDDPVVAGRVTFSSRL